MNCAFCFLALFYCDFNISFYVLSFPSMKTFKQVKVSIKRTAASYSVIQSPCKDMTLTPEEERAMVKAITNRKSAKYISC